MVLITNAPRPSAPIHRHARPTWALTRDAYDGIVSSGDVTRAMLAPYRGQMVHYVGPPTRTTRSSRASTSSAAGRGRRGVVVTDLDDDDDTPDMYNDRITLWLSRKLPLICANPDRVVEHGDRLIYCGGALADLYEARGGMS